jgi:hypothetical protein
MRLACVLKVQRTLIRQQMFVELTFSVVGTKAVFLFPDICALALQSS